MLSHNDKVQRLVGGGWVERTYLNALSWIQFRVLSTHKSPDVVRLLRQTRRQRRSLMSAYEIWILHAYAMAQSRRPGAMAEVGVFQGVSAKLLCECKGDKELHLFDTFEGLPANCAKDGNVHRLGQYATSVEGVQAFLDGYENVHIHKGLFPDSAADLEAKQYCFVNLDVDLYGGTLAGLEYFYPKMIPGGVILSHDYSVLAGVRKAFDEFLADKPEPLVELPSTQCVFTKL
ncbi:MAG TPA: macrocin-O-methyltransferase [Planctomycetaceae bacterium]|nr:macrocin-O-methyltransferase [Planctomycetaceae bacterium]